MKNKGSVTLIGAGCGRYDLMTLRGLSALKECDTVIYDSLIDDRLLDFCPDAEKICVGKRAGKHSYKQNEINELLVKKASEGRTVARLKGGDPFVFGRGGEEITALKEKGIPYRVIPGITSSVAAAELSGIPVTHRKLSRSFHVITGHTSEDLLPENLGRYAKLDGTLVFLMGLGKLSEIAEGLISGGMSGDTPAAVISDCEGKECKLVKSNLKNIFQTASRENIRPPAVIVVGETVKLDFSPTLRLPLEGVSAALTSSASFSEKLRNMLEDMGARTRIAGCLGICESKDNDTLDGVFSGVQDYDWIVLTSPNGAEIFLSQLKKKRIDIRTLAGVRFAVIGKGTAERLETVGIYPDLMPEKFTAKQLGKLLAKTVRPAEKILIFRSSEGSQELVVPLDEKGLSYTDAAAYYPVYDRSEDKKAVTEDYLIFTSASGARNFYRSGAEISQRTKIVCIGEVTANELEKFTAAKCLIPAQSTAEGIVDLILEDVNNEKIQTAEGNSPDEKNGEGNKGR